MSYNQDIFVDNCIMRLVQIAIAIRQECERSEQNNDRLTCQELDSMERELDSMEREFDTEEVESTKEIECQEIDGVE